MPRKPSPYQEVLRQNLRRLRDLSGLRREDLASRARQLGLQWDAATVTNIEFGRRQLSAAEVLMMPTLLHVPLAELLAAQGHVEFDGAAITEEGVKLLASGRPLDGLRLQLAVFAKVAAGATEAERKAAAKLSKSTGKPIAVLDLIALAQRLWAGRRLDQERDRRLDETPGQGDVARRRGHITSVLLDELLVALPTTAWDAFRRENAKRPVPQPQRPRPSTRRGKENKR